MLRFLRRIKDCFIKAYRWMDYWVTYFFIIDTNTLKEYIGNILITAIIISILIFLQPVLFWLLCIAFFICVFFLIWFVANLFLIPLCKKFDKKSYDEMKERVEIIDREGFDAYYKDK